MASHVDLFQEIRTTAEDDLIRSIDISDINQINADGSNLLHHAIAHRRPTVAEWLIRNGIAVNHRNSQGQTPLHYAAAKGDASSARHILQNGGDPNIRDSYGNTPLWTAVFNARGNYTIVELMLQNGADASSTNNAGRSPVDFARRIGDSTLVNLLER